MKHLIYLTLLAAIVSGCTHSLKISKAPRCPATVQAPDQQVALGFTPVANQPLLQAAINRLQADPKVSRSEENFKYGNGFNPDYVCELSILTNRYRASGENFLITFPGFIVFTHAWLGYRYKVDIETQSRLYDPDQVLVSEEVIHAPFEFRHCSFARGAATGICGWLLPGYGGAAVIPGAIFAASYDKRATEPFEQKAVHTYSEYVRGHVLQQLHDLEQDRAGLTMARPEGLEPIVVEQEEVGSSSEYTEDHYAVYILRTDDPSAEPSFAIKEMSAHARATMDFMIRTAVVPGESDMEGLLAELGVSPGETFGNLGEAQVMTQVGEEVIILHRDPLGISATY